MRATATIKALTAPLKKVSTLEHWLLDRTGSSDAVGITLYWGNATASGISDCNDLRIAHWNGSSWVKEAAYTSGSCSGSGAITTLSGLTSFSPFSFGSEKEQMANNPLPIELLDFTAQPEDKTVKLQWATATEVNNDFFTIEKSIDGAAFTELLKLPGAGNSNTQLNYSAVDENPYNGYSYYRLKQTDFNGEYTYSDIEAVNFKRKAEDMLTVYPNPLVNTTLKIKLDDTYTDGILAVEVYDMQGVKLLSANIDIVQMQANGYYELATHFNNGAYIVVAKTGDAECRKRVIVLN
ncbi:MAG: T9SS type A sorting domain-containing protein [Sphingobacteriales bacterium JAD_PAG50586_3]|nr:MAG: T9SS type A sorting domain-containing protein [Sphingobacteriales bacterium JAD_PAG50586_3]